MPWSLDTVLDVNKIVHKTIHHQRCPVSFNDQRSEVLFEEVFVLLMLFFELSHKFFMFFFVHLYDEFRSIVKIIKESMWIDSELLISKIAMTKILKFELSWVLYSQFSLRSYLVTFFTSK